MAEQLDAAMTRHRDDAIDLHLAFDRQAGMLLGRDGDAEQRLAADAAGQRAERDGGMGLVEQFRLNDHRRSRLAAVMTVDQQDRAPRQVARRDSHAPLASARTVQKPSSSALSRLEARSDWRRASRRYASSCRST